MIGLNPPTITMPTQRDTTDHPSKRFLNSER